MKTRIVTILFLTFLISSKSNACDCKNSKSLKEIQNREFTNSKYIFIGEILKIDTKRHTFEIKVIESFKGVKNGKVYSGIYGEFCEPVIDEVGKWLIYANSYPGNVIKINACGITRSFKNPGHNISATRPPKPPPSNASKSQIKKETANWELRSKSDLENEITDLRRRSK